MDSDVASGKARRRQDAFPFIANLDAVLPDLASSLHSLSASLADLGRRQEALTAIQ